MTVDDNAALFDRYFPKGCTIESEADSRSFIYKLLTASLSGIISSKDAIPLEDFDRIYGLTTMSPPASKFLVTFSILMKKVLLALDIQYLSRVTILFSDDLEDIKMAEGYMFSVKYDSVTESSSSVASNMSCGVNNIKNYLQKLIYHSSKSEFTSCYIVLKFDFMDYYETGNSNLPQSQYNLYYMHSKCYFSNGPDDEFRQIKKIDTTCMMDSLMTIAKVVTPFHSITAFTYNIDIMSHDMRKMKFGKKHL